MKRAEWQPEIARDVNDARATIEPERQRKPPPIPGSKAYAKLRGVLELLEGIAEQYGVTIDELMGRSRQDPIIRARQAGYDAVADRGFTLAETGRIFGTDHKSVQNGIWQHNRRQGKHNGTAGGNGDQGHARSDRGGGRGV